MGSADAIAAPPVRGAGTAPDHAARSFALRRTTRAVLAPSSRVRAAGRGEILACASGLSLLALLMCAAHIRRGGFYYDDWGVLALARFPPTSGVLHGLWLYYGQRPAQVLYYAALDELLGARAAPRLAVAAAMVVLQATLLYALLRRVGLIARDALACAALALAFPFSDSVWLWGILSLTSFAISAALLGVILALRALQSGGARSLVLHAASLALYALSILSYELFAVVGCLVGALYVRAVGFSRARYRWALDLLVILTAVLLARAILPIDIATPSRAQSMAGAVAHAGAICAAGLRLAGAALLPIEGVGPWLGTALLAAGLASAAAARHRLPADDPTRLQLGRWLVIAAAGTVIAIAAWAVYVPAPDHYSPSAAGTVNRVNALAAIGIALLIYSFLMLLGALAVRLLHAPVPAASVVALGLALALCGAYVHRSAADVRAWDAAARDQRHVLADVRAALPRPPGGAVIYTYDAPLTVGPGVPVLNTTLDETSAVRMSYADAQLTAVPVARAAGVRCDQRATLGAAVPGTYGRSYLLDVRARRAAPLQSQAQCRSAVASAFVASRLRAG
jgi:hypothetical protein